MTTPRRTLPLTALLATVAAVSLSGCGMVQFGSTTEAAEPAAAPAGESAAQAEQPSTDVPAQAPQAAMPVRSASGWESAYAEWAPVVKSAHVAEETDLEQLRTKVNGLLAESHTVSGLDLVAERGPESVRVDLGGLGELHLQVSDLEAATDPAFTPYVLCTDDLGCLHVAPDPTVTEQSPLFYEELETLRRRAIESEWSQRHVAKLDVAQVVAEVDSPLGTLECLVPTAEKPVTLEGQPLPAEPVTYLDAYGVEQSAEVVCYDERGIAVVGSDSELPSGWTELAVGVADDYADLPAEVVEQPVG